MDTVVVQSYRRENVPSWIGRSMASVESWARARGFDYRFVGDEIFDLVPGWYRERAGHAVQLLTDLGRLVLARNLLAEGYGRAVWIDADVFVFAPERLELPRERDFYLCREVWLEFTGRTIEISERVNNCVCAFERGNGFLEFYIAACEQLVRDTPAPASPLVVGTQFLTHLDRVLRLPRIGNVGLFGAYLVRDVARGGGFFLNAFRQYFRAPIYAANLCASFRNKTLPLPNDQPPFHLDDAVFERTLDALAAAGERFMGP
ncbi:MAG: hypothetical protein ACM3O6_16265 [Acidobacteriota bacterium]